MQSDKDSLTRLIEDVEAAVGDDLCRYFDRVAPSCEECPAHDDPAPCERLVLADVARRLHALMPHDADGVEIKVGDTVESSSSNRYVATGTHVALLVSPDGLEEGSNAFMNAGILRVVRPDSWERLEEDLTHSGCCAYFYHSTDGGTCDGCPAYESLGDCWQARATDIVRRAKALAGVM